MAPGKSLGAAAGSSLEANRRPGVSVMLAFTENNGRTLWKVMDIFLRVEGESPLLVCIQPINPFLALPILPEEGFQIGVFLRVGR